MRGAGANGNKYPYTSPQAHGAMPPKKRAHLRFAGGEPEKMLQRGKLRVRRNAKPLEDPKGVIARMKKKKRGAKK